MRNPNLSQHFLKSPKLALFLIGHSNLKKRDTVIEIGAGSGVITSALCYRVKQVIAIEPDHQTAQKLRENLTKRNITNVQIVEEDFLDYELFYLILQKQFALKLLNTNRHYTSKLGLELIQNYQTKIRLPLKPTDFTPPPAVPTVLFEAKRIYFPSKNAPDCLDQSL